jgi:hypothetical protein
VTLKNPDTNVIAALDFQGMNCHIQDAHFSPDGKSAIVNFYDAGALLFRLDAPFASLRPTGWDYSYAQFVSDTTIVGSSEDPTSAFTVSLQDLRTGTKVPVQVIPSTGWYPPFRLIAADTYLFHNVPLGQEGTTTMLNRRSGARIDMPGNQLHATYHANFVVTTTGDVWELATGERHLPSFPADFQFRYTVVAPDGTRILYVGEQENHYTLIVYDRVRRYVLGRHAYDELMDSIVGGTTLFRRKEQLFQVDLQSGQLTHVEYLGNDEYNVHFTASPDARFWAYSVYVDFDETPGHTILFDATGTKTRIEEANQTVFRPDSKQAAVFLLGGKQVRFIELP